MMHITRYGNNAPRMQRRHPAIRPPLLHRSHLRHRLEMTHKLDVRLAAARAEPGGRADLDAGLVVGDVRLVRALVAAGAAARERVVLADAGDIPRERGGRCGCDGVRVMV